jgi:GT2 family glycosyltransferase
MITLSVIIPTYNRVDRLARVLTALKAQTHPRDQFEVLVISDGSTDGTHAYLEQEAGGRRQEAGGRRQEAGPAGAQPMRLRWVAQANRGVAAARNCGVGLAEGTYLLFLDDDVVPAPTLITEHMRVHAAQGSDVVVLGPMLTPPGFAMRPWVRWEQTLLQRQYADMLGGRYAPTARQFYTGNTSLARRHVLDAGGFDEGLRRAEDVELAYRLAERGLRFVFEPAAAGYHYAERSYRSWYPMPTVATM